MKKMLSLLLVFTLVLSMATSAFAAEGTDCGEQPQDQDVYKRQAKPDAAPSWIATVWDSGREATLTGVGLCWRNTGLTIFFSNLPPLPSKECCSISDTAKRHNASKGKRPRFAPGALLCRGSKERPATPGEPSHFQNHILSDICSQYLSSIAYP